MNRISVSSLLKAEKKEKKKKDKTSNAAFSSYFLHSILLSEKFPISLFGVQCCRNSLVQMFSEGEFLIIVNMTSITL